MNNLKGTTFVFLGRSGSGKGTQAHLLKEFLEKKGLDALYIYTGELGRRLAKKKSLAGKWVRGVLERGDFFRNWLAVFLWFDELKDKLVNQDQVVIFDGTPRRLEEIRILDDLMADLGRPLPIIIYLDISEKEAVRRLLARSRNDDTAATIRNRLRNFNRDVMPIIKKYSKRVVRIDGEGSIEEVWERLRKSL
ncbi:MAG: nucleoside monophosphate kinase [Patescibacteria group bacterium]